MSFFTDYNNLGLMAIMATSGAALAWQTYGSGASGGKVNAAQATQLINKENAIVVDVRDAVEFAKGHLPNARHIPLDSLGEQVEKLAKDKSVPVIAICQTGARSGRACAVLKKAGFANVVNLDGGLSAWQQAGLPVVTGK